MFFLLRRFGVSSRTSTYHHDDTAKGKLLSFSTRDVRITMSYYRINVRHEDSLLMHTCFNDYVVHHYRICVRYVGMVPRQAVIQL